MFPDDGVHHERAKDGGEQNGSQEPAVQVPDDLFQHEGRGGDGRIEGGGQTRRSPSGGGSATALFGFARPSGQVGADCSRQLNAWTFPPQARSAPDAQDSRHKLHPGDPDGDEAKILPEREFELGHTAARRLRAKGTQKPAHDKGSSRQQREATQEERGERLVRKSEQSDSVNPTDPQLEGDCGNGRTQPVNAGQRDAAGACGKTACQALEGQIHQAVLTQRSEWIRPRLNSRRF